MMKHQLSVVLATHNEEDNVARCLDSVKAIADEIIVVDGESSDKTVAICQKKGARVIKTTNKPIFHINKQLAMNEAQFKLVLQMDADEVVDEELKNFILQLKKTDKFKCSAWWLKRKNLFIWKWLTKGGQYPDPVIRLYINGKARLPQKDVHEQMVVDGKVCTAKGHLLHYSNPSFAVYMKKFNSYTSLKANELYQKGEPLGLVSFAKYFLLKPVHTFLSIFLRHKGFVDGLAGFLFAMLSALHHPMTYLKLWEIYEKDKS